MSTTEDEARQAELERAWMRGHRAAHEGQLRNALSALGYDGTEAEHTKWIIEREQVVALLRRLCEEYGDNDWDEHLHLCDVIDKHLMRYIEFEEDES